MNIKPIYDNFEVTTMDNPEDSTELENKFMLSFVEMWCREPKIVDHRYKDCIGGRMEIYDNKNIFDIDEKPFATPYTKEWENFREKYDLEWVDKDELEKVIKTLREKFYRI